MTMATSTATAGTLPIINEQKSSQLYSHVKGNPEEYTKLYTNQQRLQSGSYGTVYVTKCNKTEKEYAVKIIDRTKFKNPVKDNNSVLREVDVMRSLTDCDKGIIGLIDFFITKPSYYVVLELAKGGDVFDKLGKLTVYTEKMARDLVINLLNTIDYMHNTAKIVHRDLKPENLLLKDTVDDANIRVADFGFATKLQTSAHYLKTRCGTPAFVAPEIILGQPYGKEVDMWSVGVIIYMLLGGYPPFQDSNHNKLFRKIRSADYVFHDKYWKNASVEAKQLISGLLTVNATYRISAKDALKSDWLQVCTDDNLSSRDLSGSLDEIKQYSPKNKLKAAVHSIRWAASAKFWNASKVTLNKWDSMYYALEDFEKKYNDQENQKAEQQQNIENGDGAGKQSKRSSAMKKSFMDTYEIKKLLRKGSAASVYECVKKEVSEGENVISYAVKIVDRENLTSDDDEDIMNEVSVLQSLDNEYIIKLIDFYEEVGKFYIVLEYMVGGDVFDSIVEKTRYTELDARDTIRCLLKGVSYMHSRGIAHRDLKPQNLLLTGSHSTCTEIKIADFGFAKRVHMPKSLVTRCGTPTYVAPEILKNIPHDFSVDMWSVGVITYVLLVGYPPFANENQAELFRSIRTGKYEFHNEDWSNISNEAKDFISKLLVVNPSERISANEALSHPWMIDDHDDTTRSYDDILSSNDLSSTQSSLRKKHKSTKFRSLAAAVRWVVSSTSSTSKTSSLRGSTKDSTKNGTVAAGNKTKNKKVVSTDDFNNEEEFRDDIEVTLSPDDEQRPVVITNGIKDRNLLLSPVSSTNEVV